MIEKRREKRMKKEADQRQGGSAVLSWILDPVPFLVPLIGPVKKETGGSDFSFPVATQTLSEGLYSPTGLFLSLVIYFFGEAKPRHQVY